MTALLPWERLGSKVGDRHLERLAVVYVRQSTRQQVLDHGESTRLQYGLVERAVGLGWPASRVLVIDEDLGKSGASAAGRVGFQRLVTEITMGHVGLVLGMEMSRLARSGSDWYQLLELCARCGALLADADGVYDPADYNDRRVLRWLVDHGIQLGMRLRSGPDTGELVWRRPNRMTLQCLLHSPIYAGIYAYGRRRVDPRRQVPGRPSTGRVVRAQDEWLVGLPGEFP